MSSIAAVTNAPTCVLAGVRSRRTTQVHSKAAVRVAKFGKSRAVVGGKRSAKTVLGRKSLAVQAVKEVEEDSAFDAEDIIKTLQDKWDATENKGSVALYGFGVIVTVWISNTLVGAINAVPVLPKFMELVGLGYTSWFVYRYLLFKESRQDLAADVDELKAKIAGEDEE
mmetsp:Transcript_24211/g.29360  ORF Transcript_24211/g.29360 Transcript_24211/m.29360 type:complete len:169 (-) Transcript_24211:686-1192(-)|eukprot:CAMPEP_0197857144 /NCGR_PEP_ID=MMETSP1438-20131217/29937_1 /TAXON_ID=1461541 /ORGANISM="Pterosperma sp., Strain CCMP1384" /LENGTH=168 /DNA_ID=CAMNT_0043472869 /DNA_START=113 /DNA_END=619 /DNA_ORIENTATION=+